MSLEGAWGFADSDYKLTLFLPNCGSCQAVWQHSVPHSPHLNNRELCYSLGIWGKEVGVVVDNDMTREILSP